MKDPYGYSVIKVLLSIIILGSLSAFASSKSFKIEENPTKVISTEQKSSTLSFMHIYSDEKIHNFGIEGRYQHEKSYIPNISKEYGTFKAFYKESSNINWLLAGGIALVAGGIIILTAGTATPLIASVGTSIGGMMGLSGAAATNAGLAMLGGGSLASGGLGVAGGVALITGALTFSTEVITDYSVNLASNEYSYNEFIEQSQHMTTLPIPQNTDGSNSYEKVVNYLNNNINKNESMASNRNQTIIENALIKLQYLSDRKFGFDINNIEKAKKQTLKSLLYFYKNNYIYAKSNASLAIGKFTQENTTHTFTEFLYAVSSLYDTKVDITNINRYHFRYSVIKEPENQLIPLMFAIYLDRIMYRIDYDKSLNPSVLNLVAGVAMDISDDSIRNKVSVITMIRYITLLKQKQQTIEILTATESDTILNSQQTLYDLQNELKWYKQLMNDLHRFQNSSDRTVEINKFIRLNKKYRDDFKRLKGLVKQFEETQILKKTVSEPKKQVKVEHTDTSIYKYILGLFVLVFVFTMYLVQKKSPTKL